MAFLLEFCKNIPYLYFLKIHNRKGPIYSKSKNCLKNHQPPPKAPNQVLTQNEFIRTLVGGPGPPLCGSRPPGTSLLQELESGAHSLWLSLLPTVYAFLSPFPKSFYPSHTSNQFGHVGKYPNGQIGPFGHMSICPN